RSPLAAPPLCCLSRAAGRAQLRTACLHPATPASSTLSLHDALPIFRAAVHREVLGGRHRLQVTRIVALQAAHERHASAWRSCARSEEHTSELQSRENLVCRLLLEEKKESEGVMQGEVDMSGEAAYFH